MKLSDYKKTAEAYGRFTSFEITHQFESGNLVAPQAECNCCGGALSIEEIQYIIDELSSDFEVNDDRASWICGDCAEDGIATFSV